MLGTMTTEQPWSWPETMDALLAARIRYYVGNAVQFESPEHSGALPAVRVGWMEPEGPHSVENIDERRYHAIRVELK
jgi:hypothetical protein